MGREGPIAQIGSALGSIVGQVLKLSDDRIRTLVASVLLAVLPPLSMLQLQVLYSHLKSFYGVLAVFISGQ